MQTELTKTSTNDKGITFACVKTTVKGETNDCTVRALAAATGSSYEEAHKHATEVWKREKGKGTNNYLPDFLTNEVLGHKFVPIGDKEYKMQVNKKEVVMKRPVTFYNNGGQITERKMTLKTLLERYPEGTFYVTVRKHAFTVKDGVVIGNVSDAEALRKRLLQVFKVEEVKS